MNLKLVSRLVGRVLLVEAFFMLLPLAVALLYQEDPAPFLLTILLMAILGLALSAVPATRHFYAREGFFAVGLIWLVTGVMGALPFYFSGTFPSFVDCLFESVSGFTTTGATILTDIEAQPRGILFWRAFTHWMGGMGVLVLLTALLPSLGIRSHYLTQAETPGPVFSKLVPKQSQTSKILYGIYCAMTLAEVALLKLAGMPLYDSFIHAFSTAGTGGFSNRNASVGAYGDPVLEMIIAVFALLFSINFAMYFLLLCRRFREVLQSDELRFFLVVVGLSTAVIAFNIRHLYQVPLQCLRYAFFQVSSIISTTGFATADFCLWPQFSQIIFILLMLCGACAGSTGGGLKVSRAIILVKSFFAEIRYILSPKSVQTVRLEHKYVDKATLNSTRTYAAAYMLLICLSTWLLSLDGYDLTTNLSAILSCINNVGPGLALVGPMANFGIYSDWAMILLSLVMLIGRLEIFPIFMMFSRPASLRRPRSAKASDHGSNPL